MMIKNAIKYWHQVMSEKIHDTELLVVTFLFVGFLLGLFAGLTF